MPSLHREGINFPTSGFKISELARLGSSLTRSDSYRNKKYFFESIPSTFGLKLLI